MAGLICPRAYEMVVRILGCESHCHEGEIFLIALEGFDSMSDSVCLGPSFRERGDRGEREEVVECAAVLCKSFLPSFCLRF